MKCSKNLRQGFAFHRVVMKLFAFKTVVRMDEMRIQTGNFQNTLYSTGFR
jgi:hypothetical protein